MRIRVVNVDYKNVCIIFFSIGVLKMPFAQAKQNLPKSKKHRIVENAEFLASLVV